MDKGTRFKEEWQNAPLVVQTVKQFINSFTDYVLRERTRLAKELLFQTTNSISSIASSVGYTN
ncbi:hypothetical protein MHB81_04640 [Paenibacillus sp. FSL H7-0326]